MELCTSLPVHVGENVVPGIQNSTGSLLYQVSNLSIMTVEVKVDETDIPNVKLEQPADVLIDAYPNKTFQGPRHANRRKRRGRNTGTTSGTHRAAPSPPVPMRPKTSKLSWSSTTRPPVCGRGFPQRRKSLRRPARMPSPCRFRPSPSACAANSRRRPPAAKDWKGTVSLRPRRRSRARKRCRAVSWCVTAAPLSRRSTAASWAQPTWKS